MVTTGLIVEPRITVECEDALHKTITSEPDMHELARVTNIIIGRTIKDRRKRARLSQTELANRLDRKRGFVRLVEAGRHPLTLTEFKAFADALGIDHVELARDVFEQIDVASHAFTMLS